MQRPHCFEGPQRHQGEGPLPKRPPSCPSLSLRCDANISLAHFLWEYNRYDHKPISIATFAANVDGTVALLEAARFAGVKRLVNFSKSPTVYV